MDANLKSILEKRIQKTMANLEKNNMKAYYAENRQQLAEILTQLCPAGQVVTVGGSMSLFEAGVIDFIKNGDYKYLDRYGENADTAQIFREAFFADTYFTSTNALTEQGELYNVDGNGNRVAAMIFGPKQVIVVAGYNKIVADIAEAVRRNEKISAPANVKRLHTGAPCGETGECMHCKSAGRICCQFVTMGYQRTKDRIKVILVGEELGY